MLVSMPERVIEANVGGSWDPNIDDGVLAVSEDGPARLLLRPHPDDSDRRRVELVWNDAVAARMEPPNDEARAGHRLYGYGLDRIIWVGEVQGSLLIDELERRNRVHPRHDANRFAALRHWVVPLKGSTVEVIAEALDLRRTA